MIHAALIELLLRHAYYTDGSCPDFVIRPSAKTETLLRNHRLALVSNEDGVRIVSPLGDAGAPFLPLAADAVLNFELRLANRAFLSFTDLTGLTSASGQPAPLFSNVGALSAAGGVATGGTLALLSNAGERPAKRPEVFAEVEIQVGQLPGSGAPPVTYVIHFSARMARWAYYCLSHPSTNLSELRVVDATPSGSQDVLLFSDANRTLLGEQPDPADATAVWLARKYPELRCVRMLSDQPVACRQQPREFLELRLGSERVAASLPNPSLRSAVRDDLLIRIVKYRTQPFLTQ